MSAMKSVDANYASLSGEFNILKCKLESKSEAVLILSKELDQCRSERDQFKLMASQLRERYSALKRRVEGWGPSLMGVYDVQGLKGQQQQSLALMLCELKEKNKSLQVEVDEFKQKLQDAQGDIRLLRDQHVRNRQGSLNEPDASNGTIPIGQREDMVFQLESLKNKYTLLEKDLQSLLDEKEELVTVRDAYKHKVERLNQRLNSVLRGDQQRVLDIDAILMENRYLQECQKQLEEEISMQKSSISKYKTMMEKKRGNLRNLRITTSNGTYFLSSKQVQQILQTNPLLELPNNPSSAADLRKLIVALFETLGDKSLALAHQRKTNKILANRISELEKKLKSKENEAICCKAISSEDAMNNTIESSPISSTNSVLESGSNVVPVPEDSPIKKSDDLDHDLDLLPTREQNSFGLQSRNGSSCNFHGSFSDSNPSSEPSTPVLTESPFRSLTSVSYSEESRSLATPRTSICSENDDLPPQLQKLLAMALLDLETSSAEENRESSAKSTPNHSGLENDYQITKHVT